MDNSSRIDSIEKPTVNTGLGGFCSAMAVLSLLSIGFLISQSWGQNDMKVSIGILIGTIGVVAFVSLIGVLFYTISHIQYRQHTAGIKRPTTPQ